MWTPQGGFGSSYQINIPVLFYGKHMFFLYTRRRVKY